MPCGLLKSQRLEWLSQEPKPQIMDKNLWKSKKLKDNWHLDLYFEDRKMNRTIVGPKGPQNLWCIWVQQKRFRPFAKKLGSLAQVQNCSPMADLAERPIFKKIHVKFVIAWSFLDKFTYFFQMIGEGHIWVIHSQNFWLMLSFVFGDFFLERKLKNMDQIFQKVCITY